jgi:hypothetical protein
MGLVGSLFLRFVFTKSLFQDTPHGSDRSRIVILNRNELHAPPKRISMLSVSQPHLGRVTLAGFRVVF